MGVGPYPLPGSAASQTEAQDQYDRQLQAARETFPQWELIETLGGIVAVPQATQIVDAITLDQLVMKLRQLGQ